MTQAAFQAQVMLYLWDIEDDDRALRYPCVDDISTSVSGDQCSSRCLSAETWNDDECEIVASEPR